MARLGGGALADDPHQRRVVAVGGYTTTAVLAAGTGFATSAWQVGLLHAGAWTARGLRVRASNALLADVVHPSAYGRAYGFERAMDNLGAIVGPILAIGLVAATGTRWAIAASVLPGVAAALAIVYAIAHTRAVQDRERIPIRLRVRPVLALPGLRRLFAGIGLFELANIAAWLTNIGAGHLTDRRTPAHVLTLSAGAFAVAYLGLTIDTTSWLALVPWFVAAGSGIGAVETAEHAAVATTTPNRLRGSAFRTARRHPEPRQPDRLHHRWRHLDYRRPEGGVHHDRDHHARCHRGARHRPPEVTPAPGTAGRPRRHTLPGVTTGI